MNQNKPVLLLYGGQSGEHAVSLCSAKSVLDVLIDRRMNVTCVGCSPTGQWFINHQQTAEPGVTGPALSVCGDPVDLSLAFLQDFRVAIPMMHGPLYEDGCLQGLLMLAGIPFVGSGVCGSAVSMDKVIAKTLVRASGIPVVPFTVLDSIEPEVQRRQKLAAFGHEQGFPLFVKPARMGSSVGITRVVTADGLDQAVDTALMFDTKVLIEKAVVGREFEIALLQRGEQLDASLAGEIKMQGKETFYSYQAKYLDKCSAALMMPAELDAGQYQQLQTLAKRCFISLTCQGMARADFFFDTEHGEFYFNEMNTVPGFTMISMYPALWQLSGVEYGSLIELLIAQAERDFDRYRRLKRHY